MEDNEIAQWAEESCGPRSERGARGERRDLHTAPGHLFHPSDAALLTELVELVMKNAWDAHVLCSRDSRAETLRAKISHDEWYEIFDSMRQNGGKRPGLFDAAFLMTRYKSEFAMVDMPKPVQTIVMPLLYALGSLLGKHRQFKDAPEPVRQGSSKS